MRKIDSCSTPPRCNKFVISLVLAISFAIGFFALFIREGYPKRIAERFIHKSQSELIVAYTDRALDAWNNCLNQLHINADAVFFGDSITRQGDFGGRFPNRTICNLGIGFDTINNLVNRVSMISSVSPSKVFVMCGINSLRDNTLNKSIREYDNLLHKIKSECNADVYIISTLPISKEKSKSLICNPDTIISFNKSIMSLSNKYGFKYIDLFHSFASSDNFIKTELSTDGIHLTKEAYDIWVENIKEYI